MGTVPGGDKWSVKIDVRDLGGHLDTTLRGWTSTLAAWVLSLDGDKWSVKFDVRDLGGHLDTTFRGWSATLAARVRLVIARLVLIFVLP